nr:MAG TPA: PolyVal ADP-Ribosyltransferase [Caudoviricetes sp.]
MDFFQRVGNFFSGKGWVSDDERRRKEQQVQAPVQPRPQPLQQVQQPNINRLNGLSGVNTPGLGGGTNIFSQAQQKVNPNPLQQANQATQQLNQNNQPKPLIPEKTVNDAPKVLTPQGQQDWVNKENKQIQIQNVINNPTQVLKSQVQQQQPKPAPVAIQQPQQQNRPQIAPSFPNPVRNPLFTQNQDSLTHALDIAKQESDKYKAEQAARNDKLDNIMRARGVSEPEIAKNRQVRIDAENRAYLSEDKARRDSNIAQMAGLATLPTRSVVSFTKGAIDGAGRTVGDSGDKISLAVADAMYGITGDESYDRIRKYIVEQGKQRNAQYDRDLGVFKKNDTDVATAYEAGQSAQRLAQDIGTGVATGGAIPVARQFVENAADFITNANAKGKSTREMLPYAYGNAAVQAGIEKLGLDKVLSPIGKKGLTKFITGAIAEGSEEAAQQFAENAIAKHTYDPNRKYEEGVLKSGLMGAVLGGPAGMANFGAMRQTGNQPSSAMTARMNQNEATGKLEKEAIAQRQARQSSDDTSLKQAAEVNVANNQNNQLHPIQSVDVAPAVENTIPNASPALKQAVTQNMSDIQHGDVNAVATRQQTTGILENYLIEQATKDVQSLASSETKYKLNPEHEAQVRAYNEHITRLRQREEYLRGQGMSENAPAMINLRKAQEQAIYARDHIGEVDENGLKYKLSPEQEAFFKDSKVRDEDGNLMKMYHGSPNGHITEFRPGTYFTKDKKYANGYQNPEASYISLSSFKEVNDPKTYEVYINSKNPFTLNDSRARDIYLNEFVKGGNSLYLDPYSDHTDTIKSMREIDWMEGEGFREWLRENHPEYDSLYLDEGGDGGYGEKTIDKGISLVMTKPEQIKYTDNLNPTDSPDMRYKLDAKMQELASQNNLLARHLQLTGDENLVFNEWQNEMQKRALGYYNPKTDTINLNKLTEDTLNHELGHKLLTRVENKQDLLNTIRESYGDEYLINKYGSQYGNDLNLLAEEQLADGFSDYYNGRLNGEDKVRLGTRLGIPQKVLAIYDRITEAVMGLVGKQDAIKQFYAQMETGKFRGVSQVSARATKPQPAYRIDPNTNIVYLDEGYSIPPNTRTGDIGRIIRGRIRQFINQDFDLGESGIQARVTSDTINEVSNKQPSMRHWQFVKKGEMSNNFNELLNAMQNVRVEEMNPAKANQKGKIRRNADYYIKGDVIVDVGGDLYEATIVNEVDKLGNVLAYDISGIRKSTGRGLDSSAISADALDQSIDNSSIPNNPQDVNTDNRYKHPLQETINEMEANPKPKMTRELREAIDEFIYENIDQNLFLEHNDTNILGSHGLTWSIPRLHVDDLRHHLGKELAGDLPSNYKRRTGKRDIDTVAQEMGYDDIDTFIDEVKRVAEARRAERERKTLLAEWRRDPDVIKEAQKMIAERHAEEAKVEAEKQKKIEEAKAEKERIEKQQALGEILNRGLDEGPRHKIADIVHNASVATGIDEKAVAKQFAKLAEQKGYDITGERALLNTNARAGSMLDENGRLRPIDEIAPEVKEKIKLPGAEHAVPAPTTTANTATHNTRQMIYKDEKGAYHSFYEYRNIFGKWQRTGAEAPRVTSPLQKKFIDDIRSDKAVNDEAKRAFDDGLAIQYIWRENSKGVNAELVSAFDGYMQTGDKKAYRPSDKLVTFDPDKHYIESGRVVDAETGQILGNYIEMTPDGNVTIYAGKKKMNLNMRDVDFSKIKEMRFGAGQTWTTEGIIDRITGSLRRSNSLDYFKKGGNKTKEALLNIMSETPRQANAAAVKEGNAIGEQIKDYRKNLLKQAKKHGPLKRQMLQDAVYVIEPSRPKRGEKSSSYDERLKVFEDVYGKSAAEALDQYNSFLRAVYKNLLARQNEKRVELGKDPIMERKDYITHLGEMQSGKGSIAAMYGGAKNLLSGGDVAIESRQSLPAKLAGRTGLFKPSQKFNQFAMQRVGDVKPTDPFTPLMEYSKIALHNIHMTDAITMNRSLEVAVRAASEARQEFAGKGTSGIQKLADRVDALYNSAASGNVNAEELTQVRNKLYGLERAIGRKIDGIRELNRLARKADKFGVEKLDAKDINSLKETTNNMAESLDKMLNDVNFMKLMSDSANGLTQFVGFVQEHANRLAGKTDPFQRVVNDTEPSKMRKFADATGRALMKQAALSKIVGNMNSVVAQTASLPALFSTTNPKALIQAFKLKNRKAILQKSDALALRYADDNLTDDTKFEKTMKTAGIPMEVVERGVIEYTFLAKYNQAINNGLSDADAVRYAERFINDTVTLRDQISTPRAYNRLLPASFLQFTREVTQQNRYVWNQMTNKQRVALAVNTAIAYSAIEALTGNKPGVDPLGTLIEIVGDWLSGGDDDDKDNSVQAKLERTAQKVAGQAVAASPIATAMVNAATTKDDRKKLFGKESNLGRYDGTIPVVDLPRKLIDTKGKLDEAAKAREDGDDDKAEAKTKDAMYNILGQLPAGSQLKKTIQGIAAAHSGEVKDGNGETKVEFEKDNPFNLVQGALFGKNALIPVQVEEGKSSWVNLFKTGGLVANASNDIQINMPTNNNPQQKQATDNQIDLQGLSKKEAASIKKKLKKGDYTFQDGLLVNKNGNVEKGVYKKLAQSQGQGDEAYRNWMKAYDIDKTSTIKKEFTSFNATLNKLQNGTEKVDKAKTAVNMMTGKYKDLPDWVKERYYKESGYTKDQIEYGAMTSHNEVSLMDNYWRQKAQESSHEDLIQELANGRRKSITGQMFAKNGVINKLRAEGYITKQEARALNATQFDTDGNKITKDTSGGSGRSGSGSGRGRGRRGGRSSGGGSTSPLASATAKSMSLTSSAPKANESSAKNTSINQIGQNLISKTNTQKQITNTLKKWNGASTSKNTRIRIKKT